MPTSRPSRTPCRNARARTRPWLVVPANHKWFRNYVIARTIADTLEAMDPRFPKAAKGIADLKVPD